jgi:LmbE family N-acetylglucosaminyl deacetylase
MLERAILAVAHPDDEVLWFASILRAVEKVIIAFKDYDAQPGLGARRTAAMAELPYRSLVSLDIAEAGSLKRADWNAPVATDYGLALDEPETRRRYEGNFATLRARLASELRGASDVFTHNPWGEYGHEDHVQMYRAVESLRGALGFRLWTPSCYATRSEKLAARYRAAAAPPAKCLPIDQGYARFIAAIYERHDCWTWTRNWSWPAEECFLPGPFRVASPAEAGLQPELRFVVSEL